MPRCSRHLRALAAVTVAFCLEGAMEPSAKAQALLERFDPAERGSRFFVADSLELDGSFRFTTGLVTAYGSHLRTFRQAVEPERSNLVEQSVWLHPGASLVMSPGARFGIDVPIAVQSGNGVTLDRAFHSEPGSPRVGDVRASFDLRLAGRERSDKDGAVVAAGVSAYLPTGSSSDYTSDDFARVMVRLATSVQGGPVLVAARVGYMYRKDGLPPFGGVALGSEANGVLAAGYRGGRLVVGPELHGSTIVKSAFERRSSPVEVLMGAHLTLGDFMLGAGLGTAAVSGLGSARVRGVLSIEWTPIADVPHDRDHDGVMDADDMCPDVPGSAHGPVGSRGCPEAPHDSDGDGIVDGEDACPDLRGIASHDTMTNGCPDADHDGIPDPMDACPTVAGVRSVLPRYNGCPPDGDGDGVPDERDACPDEPGVASEDPDKDGCVPPPPPPPDRDEDGVVDASDACPDAAGPASAIPEANGCPLARPEPTVTLQLGFEAGALTTESDHFVARQAAALLAYPELHVLVVMVAPPRSRVDPKRAAQQRTAVLDRLVGLGVAKERFDARRGATALQRRNQIELRVAPLVP